MKQKTADEAFVGGCILAVVAAVIGLIILISSWYGSARDVTFTVKNDTRSCTSKSCTNLIYTDHGVFQDVDSIFSNKYNSSDIYGQLCVGGTYKVHVRGWRIPFLSEWPNILKIDQVVKQGPNC